MTPNRKYTPPFITRQIRYRRHRRYRYRRTYSDHHLPQRLLVRFGADYHDLDNRGASNRLLADNLHDASIRGDMEETNGSSSNQGNFVEGARNDANDAIEYPPAAESAPLRNRNAEIAVENGSGSYPPLRSFGSAECPCCANGCRSRITRVIPWSAQLGTRVFLDNLTGSKILKVEENLVQFFRSSSDPSDPFDKREARDAYSLRDKGMKDDDYIFIWKRGKKGRLILTLKECGSCTRDIKITTVTMGVDGGDFQQVAFKTRKDLRMNWEVVVPLDASIFRESRLKELSPSYGTVEEKFVTLNMRLEVEMDNSGGCDFRIPVTVFCQVRKKKKTRLLYCMQRRKLWWSKLSQFKRDCLGGAWWVAKLIPERILRLR